MFHDSATHQGREGPPPAPPINLESALAHMPEANAQDVDPNLTSLQAPEGPTTTAAAYVPLGAEPPQQFRFSETKPRPVDPSTDAGEHAMDPSTATPLAAVDPMQAQYDHIFSCTRGNPRSSRSPPGKQPRLSLAAGFNSLPQHKQCQLLTHANVATATMLPHYLKMLLEVDKPDRLSWFNTHALPDLKNRDAEAFASFHYTADFVDLLCDVKLTTPSTDNWWDSPFVGGQLYRNKEDIQHLNRLHRIRGNAQMQLQVNPQQLGSLSSKAPVPITTLPELLNFLKRVWHCSTMFLPLCDLGSLARDIYKALLQQQRPLSADPGWLAVKPGEIIHRLQQANNAEFTH